MDQNTKYIDESGVEYLVEGLKSYADSKLGGNGVGVLLTNPRAIFKWSNELTSSFTEEVEVYSPNSFKYFELQDDISYQHSLIWGSRTEGNPSTDSAYIVAGEYLVIGIYTKHITPTTDLTTNSSVVSNGVISKWMSLVDDPNITKLDSIEYTGSISMITRNSHTQYTTFAMAHIKVSNNIPMIFKMTEVSDCTFNYKSTYVFNTIIIKL